MTLPSFPARTTAGADGLTAIRKNPQGAVLGFDFDGTLAPIVEDPAAARAHPQAAAHLARLAPLVGAVVIITGRPAAVAVEYGGFEGIDGLVVLGQYGLERWEAGVLTVPEPPPGVAEVRAKLPHVLAAAGAPDGTYVEDKGHALAVHTRRTAEPQVALDRLRGILEALAERTGLAVEPGRYVLELRPPGMDKGVALRSFLAERTTQAAPTPGAQPSANGAVAPAAESSAGRAADPSARAVAGGGARPAVGAGVSAVLFAGDDLGDLAAFDAVDALRAEGVAGVKVCSGSAEVIELAERADLVVDGPDGVARLMAELADVLG